MPEYRIVKRTTLHGEVYIIQRKGFFAWHDVQSIAEMPLEFLSIERAEEAIKVWGQKDVVIKNV